MSPLGTTEGFTWLDGKAATIPINGLTANVLCTRHNAALSPLDARVGQFYREVVDAEEFLRKDEREPRVRLFSGYDLELWSLKVLCGLVAAGVADHSAGNTAIDRYLVGWSRVLFGELMFVPRIGLYAYVPLQHQKEAKHQVAAAVISNPEIGIYGLRFDLRSKMFLLALIHAQQPPPENSLLKDAIYHPEEFLLTAHQSTVHFFFSWDNVATCRGITWNYTEG